MCSNRIRYNTYVYFKKIEYAYDTVFYFRRPVLFSLKMLPVASLGFVARRQRLKLYHGALTVDFRAGCSSYSMTNSFVTNTVTDRKSCELLTSASANLADYLALRLGSRGRGHVPQCPIAGDATELNCRRLATRLAINQSINQSVNLYLPQ